MNKDKTRYRMLKLALIMVSLTVLFVVSTDQSSAATINVGSGAGNDSATIQGGINAASANDNIIVHNNPNNYTGTTVVNKTGLKIKAAPGEDVTVQPGTGYGFQITGFSNITIDRFTILGSTRNGGYGILAQAYSHNCTISNNFIGNINIGISFAGTNNTFTNNYINNTLTGMTLNNAVPGGLALGNFVISNNKIENVNNGILGTGLTNFQISNNNITSIAAPVGTTTGIDVSINSFLANQNNIINNNIITGANKAISTNTAGIKFQNSGASTLTNHNLQIYSNSITNYFRGIQITNYRPTGGATNIYLNRIYDNTIGMSFNGVATSGLINAINNWWGKNTAPTILINSIEPSTAIDIWKSSALGSLNYNPWIVLNVNASPSTINTGQTSTITADLTQNSNNEDTTTLYPGKYVPDGITANFSSDSLGTVNPVSAATVSGKANTTFTAGSTAGTSHPSATVDAATVNTDVNVQESNPPVVNSVDPVNSATNIPVNQVITVTFDKDIQAGLFGPYNSISLFDGTKYISLIKNIAGNILTLTPAENLIPGTTYTINIPYFAIADLTGNLLQSTYTSTFTTIPNIINPVINTIDPVNAAINVPVNQVITVTFNKDIQAGLFGPYNSISLFDGTKYISLIKNIAGNILTLTPAENLIPGTTYTINIPYFAIADLTGNLLQSTYTSTFTTIPNIINPVINTIDPVNAATNIPVNQVITVTFNKDIQAGLLGPYNSIYLQSSLGTYIPLIKNIAGNVLTLTPTENLIPGTIYTVNIPYFAIADLTGNLLQSTYTSTFTTA